MRIGDDWLTGAATQAVFGMLQTGGHRALAVGGCVRNALLGVPVVDIDLATDAVPDRVLHLAEKAGLRAVPTGIAHGTVTIVSDGVAHEVTTFRRDIDTDGRHATVAFSDDPAEDAARRDFTMNALYCDAEGRVVDPLGGLDDLRARRVRFIGDPHARIAEDYLRIPRFFRFTALYGDPALGIDAEGLAACAALAEGIDRLSAERVTHELRKLLAAPDPAPAVASMAQAGVLWRILPGAEAATLPVLVHLEALPGDWIARLAALGGEVTGLRLSRAEVRELEALSQGARGDARPFALGHALGGDRARDALTIRAALHAQAVAPGDIEAALRGAGAEPPVTARDLMPDFTGPALGDALARVRDIWLAHEGEIDREALLAAARGDAGR
ncbi:CCA tRNA nucleotidyltransferase [Jannaschia sp. S6380]|uniref:CCA tRNA nucleotidyltransferase n=1 Tax=Jannaschia sp. S6380 TaxID=2926408 RepID=UPI001FF65A6D|nr:CCA tRNA nucleotidyltransferase [Jannaschia sp. S6380]MCK0168764.1 CCA tRNA nucleotidyltransferase [Jannaschia sp. S6380]